MKFMDQSATYVKLKELVATSKSIKIAVAFWGHPAHHEIGLLQRHDEAELICNLKMGGTNPAVIEELIDGGMNVKQSDHLHGKVYLFDDAAVVGSSNISANGLSLQGSEVAGWREANILVTEKGVLEDVRAWVRELPVNSIKSNDLDAAKEAWSRRRRAGGIYAGRPTPKTVLIDDLRNDPQKFTARRLYVCLYSEGLSKAGNKSLKFAKKGLSTADADDIDGFEWDDLPDYADLICFWNEGGKFTHDGIWNMPEVRREITKFGTRLQVCIRLRKFDGYPPSRLGSVRLWSSALAAFTEDGDHQILDLGSFAEKYLR